MLTNVFEYEKENESAMNANAADAMSKEIQTLHIFMCAFLGMNEYASTLLYVMRNESLAYICFCSVMKRIRANFSTDGVAMATKFHHLKVLLRAIDPVYWNFLESYDAGKSLCLNSSGRIT
jgi:hypothetical protein